MNTEPDPGIIRGQRFELVDQNGRLTLAMYNLDGEPVMEFYDRNRLQRITARLWKDSPSIGFYSPEGQPWFTLGENPDECLRGMEIQNLNCAPAFRVDIPKETGASLSVFDIDGTLLWSSDDKNRTE